jgi:hypothetical protein
VKFFLTAAAAFVVGAAPLCGQGISGTVTDRTSGLPIAGVVVTAVDARKVVLVRAVTDARNGYRIAAVPGIDRLEFRRIGFSPRSVSIIDSVAGRLDVVMNRLPVQLPPVKALAAAQCDKKFNGGEVLALWEEVRSALLTSITARHSRRAASTLFEYTVWFDKNGPLPYQVRRHDFTLSTPFRAVLDPATLARRGYHEAHLIGPGAYLAPDDEVLFDESFLSTHCFALGDVRKGDDSTIALRFEPEKGRRVVDVAGTVLLRKHPIDLKSVEYTYTNTSREAERAKAGGVLRFGQMPNGITMLQDWAIRSPPLPRSRFDRGPVILAIETRGMIHRMQWPEGEPYVVPLARLTGVVMDKLTRQPIRNAIIGLPQTPFFSFTDTAGAFVITDVLPGKYEIAVGDSALETFDAHSPRLGPFDIVAGDVNLNLTAEGPLASAQRGCLEKREGRTDFTGPQRAGHVVFGTIRLENGRPFRRLPFEATVTPVGGGPVVLQGRTDADGRFRVCGLPFSQVRVSVANPGAAGTAETTIDELNPYQIVRITAVRAP